MASGRRSGGVAFEDLFAPDIVGDGPTAAGYRSGGGLLRFAAIKYGTKRADVGYRVNGVDVSNLWAAKGTASYALSIDGQTFDVGVLIPAAGSGSAGATFSLITASTWRVLSSGAGGTLTPASGTVMASGSVPSGAATVQYTATRINTGSDGGAVVNDAPTAQALAAGLDVSATISGTGSTQGRTARFSVNIVFRNAGGSIISSSTIILSAHFDGSA